ncbi:MAG: acyl-CoA dehydrogenase family protein [Planctomycetes bacterium]|nr:acyl-CoA dehydrogenase family protein [Planctomycetota bacterium]
MTDTRAIRAFLEPRHLDLAREVGEFACREIAPLPVPGNDDEARAQARVILSLVGRAGYFGYVIPKAFGGQCDQPDLRSCSLVREALAAASPLADLIYAVQCLGSMPIVLAGSEAMKARWLPRVARGEVMAAFAMTEPEAGSDVSSMKTTARPDDRGYTVDGFKTLISNAGIADFYSVFATSDPAKGTRGISCLLVEAETPGLRFVKPQVLSAPHPLGQIAFESCRVPASARIGQEGEGFKVGMATLDRLRTTVAAAACGMAARALSEATRYALQRRQFGKPLSEHQITQQKLARMAIDLTASRLLVYRSAWEKDGGAERVTVESAMAKAFATEAAQRIIDDGLQILGGIGVLAEHPVERLYRAIRALRIYEGTTEVQHLIIAGHLLKEANGHRA